MILVDSHLKIMIYNPKRHKIPNGRSIGVVKGCENLNGWRERVTHDQFFRTQSEP